MHTDVTDSLPRTEDRSFDSHEQQWFDGRPRRASQRPTLPAPSVPPALDDSVADGWFRDV